MNVRSWMIGVLAAAAGVIVVAILSIAVLSSGSTTSIVDLDVGDCFDLPISGDDVGIDTVDIVGCGEPHEAEVVGVGVLNPDGDREYPTDDDLFAEVEQRCGTVQVADPERWGLLPIAPDEATWDTFDGRFVCVAIPFGGGRVTGSIVADRT